MERILINDHEFFVSEWNDCWHAEDYDGCHIFGRKTFPDRQSLLDALSKITVEEVRSDSAKAHNL